MTAKTGLRRAWDRNHILTCETCGGLETDGAHETGKLIPMYRKPDDCVICQRCVDKPSENNGEQK